MNNSRASKTPSPQRQKFLTDLWLPYPRFPGQGWQGGRIEKLTSEGFKWIVQDGIGPRGISRFVQWPDLIEWGPLKGAGPGTRPPIEILSLLQAGDLVAVRNSGTLQMQLLVPCLRSQEQTPVWSPSQLGEWNLFLQEVREILTQRGLLEVTTPTLVNCPGTEPYLETFQTEFKMGKTSRTYFLPTSPELHLKKILSFDSGPIFEIKSCFRNGEISKHHSSEFTMLEWYRPFAALDEIAEDLEQLLRTLSSPKCKFEKIEKISMAQLFLKYTGVQLEADWDRAKYLGLAQKLGIHTDPSDTISDLFHRVFLEKIEAQVPRDIPLLVYDFPPFQAAYARLNDRGFADRFELYWQGLELANAFHEVNDPVIQRQRMNEDLQTRALLHKDPVPLDESFFEALESGMPPAGGIALGLERLFMIVNGLDDIALCRPFVRSR
jgi:lysyl-tRNA synthetase class 2